MSRTRIFVPARFLCVMCCAASIIFDASTTCMGTALNSEGHPLCPCLTRDAMRSDVLRNSTVRLSQISNTAGRSSLSDPDSIEALKRQHGVGCGFHDSGESGRLFHDECADPSRGPRFCSAAWCYVDRGSCSLSHTLSEFRVGRSYSYASCGYLNSFKPFELESALFVMTHSSPQIQNNQEAAGGGGGGAPLRIVQMENTGGWKGSYCTRHNHCTGPAAQILDLILKDTRARINVTHTFTVPGALLHKEDLGTSRSTSIPSVLREPVEQIFRDLGNGTRTTSSFNACSYAAGMGYVDLCAGAFIVTPARQLRSDIISLWQEPVYLVTTWSDVRPGFWELAFSCFAPFQPEAWAALVGFVGLVSMLIGTLERSKEDGADPDVVLVDDKIKKSASTSSELPTEPTGHPQPPRSRGNIDRVLKSAAKELPTWKKIMRSVCDPRALVRKTARGFDADRVELKLPSSRLMHVAMSFVLMIAVSNYTANLATQLLLHKNRVASVNSIQEILGSDSHRVCAPKEFQSALEANLGLRKEQIVRMMSRADVFSAIGQQYGGGGANVEEETSREFCVAGIVTLEDFTAARRHGSFCNLTRVGDPVYHMTWGAPASARAFRSLAYFYTKAETSGEQYEILERHAVQDRCASGSDVGDDDAGRGSGAGMDLTKILGPLIIAVFLTIAGLVVECVAHLRKTKETVRKFGAIVLSSPKQALRSVAAVSTRRAPPPSAEPKPRGSLLRDDNEGSHSSCTYPDLERTSADKVGPEEVDVLALEIRGAPRPSETGGERKEKQYKMYCSVSEKKVASAAARAGAEVKPVDGSESEQSGK